MQGLEKLLGNISNWVWGIPLLVLLFGTHLFLTFRLRFIQRYIGKAIKLSFQRKTEGAGDVSHFGALTTALAATIGTGNIVGVVTVTSGRPSYQITSITQSTKSLISKLIQIIAP